MTGVVQNQDSYMKGRVGQRAFFERAAGRAGRRVRRLGAS